MGVSPITSVMLLAIRCELRVSGAAAVVAAGAASARGRSCALLHRRG